MQTLDLFPWRYTALKQGKSKEELSIRGTPSYHKFASSVLVQISLPLAPVQPWKSKTEGNYSLVKHTFIVYKRNSRTLTNISLFILSQSYNNAGIK